MNRAVVVALLLVPSLALADAKSDAEKLLDDGVKLLKGSKDYAGALAKFEEAYATYPSPKIFANIASSLKGLGRNAEAANYEQRYLNEGGPDATNRRGGEKVLAELDATLGFVTITVEPDDRAEVRIGGSPWWPVGTLAKWRVAPGDIVIEARRPGSKDATARSTINKGATEAVSITLEPDVAIVEPEPEPEPESEPERPSSSGGGGGGVRLGALVHVLVDAKVRGWGGALGALLAIGERVDVEAAALLSPHHVGGYLGAGVALTTGTVRPRLSAGFPVMVSNGPRWAVRGAGGVEWRASSRLSLIVELGVEYMFNPEVIDDIQQVDTVVLVPTLGAHGSL